MDLKQENRELQATEYAQEQRTYLPRRNLGCSMDLTKTWISRNNVVATICSGMEPERSGTPKMDLTLLTPIRSKIYYTQIK